MIERDELVYVVMGVLYGLTTPGMVNKILDAVEPLIRDDEDERIAQAIEAKKISQTMLAPGVLNIGDAVYGLSHREIVLANGVRDFDAELARNGGVLD